MVSVIQSPLTRKQNHVSLMISISPAEHGKKTKHWLSVRDCVRKILRRIITFSDHYTVIWVIPDVRVIKCMLFSSYQTITTAREAVPGVSWNCRQTACQPPCATASAKPWASRMPWPTAMFTMRECSRWVSPTSRTSLRPDICSWISWPEMVKFGRECTVTS